MVQPVEPPSLLLRNSPLIRARPRVKTPSLCSRQLAGKIWIADFIFTTCPGPCPIISTRMGELQRPLEKTDVHLVSFTVDPEKDTPEVLRAYAEKLHARPQRWDFLTGPRDTIHSLRERLKLACPRARRRWRSGPHHPFVLWSARPIRVTTTRSAGTLSQTTRRREPSPAPNSQMIGNPGPCLCSVADILSAASLFARSTQNPTPTSAVLLVNRID